MRADGNDPLRLGTFGLDSQRHDGDAGYTLANECSVSILGFAAIGATANDGPKIATPTAVWGMPLLLATELDEPTAWRVRLLCLRNARRADRRTARRADTSLQRDRPGSPSWRWDNPRQDDLPEHAPLRLATTCDAVLAVSEHSGRTCALSADAAGVPLEVVPLG